MKILAPKNARAILQNARGEFLDQIDDQDVADFELLADNGKVERLTKKIHGRWVPVFRLLAAPEMGADPSNSRNSACCLTRSDMDGLAGIDFPEARTSKLQIERWIGYGLLPATGV